MNPLTSSTRLARGLLDINTQVLSQFLTISSHELRDGVAAGREYFERLPRVRGLGQLVSLQRDLGSRVFADGRRHLRERGAVLLRAAEDTGSLLTDVLYGKAGEARRAAREVPAAPQESANDAELPLTEINGVGPALAKRLEAAGLTTLEDVAALNPDALEAEDHPLHDLKGRIAADRWIAQARRLVGAGKVVNL